MEKFAQVQEEKWLTSEELTVLFILKTTPARNVLLTAGDKPHPASRITSPRKVRHQGPLEKGREYFREKLMTGKMNRAVSPQVMAKIFI